MIRECPVPRMAAETLGPIDRIGYQPSSRQAMISCLHAVLKPKKTQIVRLSNKCENSNSSTFSANSRYRTV